MTFIMYKCSLVVRTLIVIVSVEKVELIDLENTKVLKHFYNIIYDKYISII